MEVATVGAAVGWTPAATVASEGAASSSTPPHAVTTINAKAISVTIAVLFVITFLSYSKGTGHPFVSIATIPVNERSSPRAISGCWSSIEKKAFLSRQ